MQVTAVSAKTNTTATSRLGAFTEGNCQVALYDTPGVVHTRYILPCTLVHVACVVSSLQMRTKSLDAVPRYAVTALKHQGRSAVFVQCALGHMMLFVYAQVPTWASPCKECALSLGNSRQLRAADVHCGCPQAGELSVGEVAASLCSVCTASQCLLSCCLIS